MPNPDFDDGLANLRGHEVGALEGLEVLKLQYYTYPRKELQISPSQMRRAPPPLNFPH